MRFKKLKILVAIALVIFILIVANTISFSLLQNNQDTQTSKLVTSIDSRKNSSIIKTASTSSQTFVNQIQRSSQTSTATAPATSSNTQITISHPKIKTRAS